MYIEQRGLKVSEPLRANWAVAAIGWVVIEHQDGVRVR